jgi:RNA polymerase sigma-70 factor (ECF subfamily)
MSIQGLRAAAVLEVAQRADGEPTAVITAAIAGDLRAFERLYRQYAPAVYGLCLRLTGERTAAEDCTQESFVAAWRALPGFERRSRFTTWLHRIAVNTVLNRRRRPAAVYEVPTAGDALPDAVDNAAGPPPVDLEKAVAALPEGARQVLVLVGIYGYTHAEAAAMLGIAEGTCKAQLHRARGLIAAAVGREVQ